jgi:hypothetical protein
MPNVWDLGLFWEVRRCLLRVFNLNIKYSINSSPFSRGFREVYVKILNYIYMYE